jgi:regulator of protease activity HflC (stomatin/prohibitin superfamily)
MKIGGAGRLAFLLALLAAGPAWAAEDDSDILKAAGGFGIIVLAIIGVVFLRRIVFRLSAALGQGPRALLGQQKVIIDTFKSGILYRSGVFERTLPAGAHWINMKNARAIAVDMRPQVMRLVESVLSADRRRARVSVTVRFQVADVRAAVECATDYREECLSLIRGAARALALTRTFRELNLHQAEFNEAGKTASDRALNAVGGRCLSFELSDVDLVGEIAETEDRDIGFKAP